MKLLVWMFVLLDMLSINDFGDTLMTARVIKSIAVIFTVVVDF